MHHRIFVETEPFPQVRPRICRNGNFDPSSKKKKYLGFLIKNQWKEGVLDGIPVELILRFYMPIPKSLSKKKKELLVGTPHIKKIDIDNLVKSTMDSMIGIVYKDDSIVWKVLTEKFYSKNSGIEILILY